MTEPVCTQREAMLLEAQKWRASLRSPIGVRCRPACALLSQQHDRTMHEPGCWWEYAMNRVYELERALGL